VFFKLIKNNDFLVDDGVRDVNKKFQQQIEQKILSIYNELGYQNIIYM
jgi:hypothetical protein